jgi:hypothetical protein
MCTVHKTLRATKGYMSAFEGVCNLTDMQCGESCTNGCLYERVGQVLVNDLQNITFSVRHLYENECRFLIG